jgi:hypothetical protein
MGLPVQPPFVRHNSGEWVDGTGIVCRLLTDDHDGSRHQRFVLDMRNGQTLLVAHNIDIADRIPLGMGDKISFRGMYEWNDRGGLIHWTHHDPMGVDEGGHIVYRNTRIR